MSSIRFVAAAVAVLVFLTGLAAGVFVTAGGDDSTVANAPTPTPTPAAAVDRAPRLPSAPSATLVTQAGMQVKGGLGTRCWTGGCVDMVGPLSNPDPIRLAEPFTITFEAGTPSAVHASWVPVSGNGELMPDGQRLWSMPPGQPASAAPAAATTPPAAPGRYLYVVFAQWQGRGDVSYAWYIERP